MDIQMERNRLLELREVTDRKLSAEKEEVEKRYTKIEKEYETIKQYHACFSSASRLNRIKKFCQEIDECGKMVREKIFEWEKKINEATLQKIKYEDNVRKQEERVYSVELATRFLKCLLKAHREMEEQQKRMGEFTNWPLRGITLVT